jgi:Galactose-1-phosphate uridyltransferase
MIDLSTFYNKQLEHWPLARENYEDLATTQERDMGFDEATVKVQFNPSRIRSAAADLDEKALAARPCPLCLANHPKEQDAIPFDERFSIAVNPYPVFDRHFTLFCNVHTPQVLKGNLDTMLTMAERLPDYAILYNGPRCGASIPDHLHFQAIPKGLLPVEDDWTKYGKIGLRSCHVLDADDKQEMITRFNQLLEDVFGDTSGKEEPMMNLVCRYIGQWRLFLFPRKQHRPRQYYATGEEQILTSPGVIDMAGVFVFPREEDYKKMTKEIISDIYTQVAL